MDEISSIVEFLMADKITRIGILKQNDQYGEDALTSLTEVLDAAKLQLVSTGVFDAFGEDMPRAFSTLHTAAPDAVILAGVSSPVLEFIKMAISSKWSPKLFFLSFDIDGLLRGLSSANMSYPGDLFVTSVVPAPMETNSSLAARFRATFANLTASIKPKEYQKPTFFGMEGFITARFIITVFDEMVKRGINLTISSNMVDLVYNVSTWKLDDETLGPFVEGCNQGLHTVHLYCVEGFGTVSLVKRWVHRGCGNETDVKPQKQFPTTLVIACAAAGGGALLILIAAGVIMFVIRKRRTRQRKNRTRTRTRTNRMKSRAGASRTQKTQMKPLLSKAEPTSARQPFHMQAMADVLGTAHSIPCIRREELDEFALVGSGSSAKVFRAKWHGTVVAVKQLHNPLELSLDTVVKEVAEEIKLWSQLKHPHVVQFLGMTPDLWLVMEFMEHGSLKTLMRRRQIPPDMRIRLLFQVALAIDYLHSRKVIHRDLNPNNIMVSGPMRDLQAKVADFGLSRMEQALLQHTKSVGTPVYASPEVLYGGLFTPKSDSYSFGLTLWFVETSEEPFEDVHSHFELIEAVVKNKRKPNPARCTMFPELVASCTQEDPEQRPTFSSIASQLQAGLARQVMPALAQSGSPPIVPLPSSSSPSSAPAPSASATSSPSSGPEPAPLLRK